MITYVLAIIIGILGTSLFMSRKTSSQDQAFQHEEAALDEAIQTKKAEAAKQQETTDDLVKKFQEEMRDYSSDDGGNKPSSS